MAKFNSREFFKGVLGLGLIAVAIYLFYKLISWIILVIFLSSIAD